MPRSCGHIQASLSLTLEFVTNPTNSLLTPVPELIIHLAWPFLDPLAITILCVASPVMSCYGKLCTESRSITAVDIQRIHTPLDHRTSTSSICSLWVRDAAKILLLCYFCPGGMIRCLGGLYTSDFLDFASIDACLTVLSDIPANPGEPPVRLPCAATLVPPEHPLQSFILKRQMGHDF